MYSEELKKQIVEIAERINGRKDHDFAPATFRDAADLKRMAKLVEENLSDDVDSIGFAYQCYAFLGDRYAYLCRRPISANYYLEALKLSIKLFKDYKEDHFKKDAPEILKCLLRDRNFYVDDDCSDVLALVRGTGLIDDEKIDQIYQKRMQGRRTFKNDPVEMTPEYLAVIDEIEERVEKNQKLHGMGSCFEAWDLKQQYLAEKGITWTPPNLLNRNIMFD